jgi:hypothetical protein
MADEENDDIDLEKVVWDPRYRRAVIERINRKAAQSPAQPSRPPAQRAGITIR